MFLQHKCKFCKNFSARWRSGENGNQNGALVVVTRKKLCWLALQCISWSDPDDDAPTTFHQPERIDTTKIVFLLSHSILLLFSDWFEHSIGCIVLYSISYSLHTVSIQGHDTIQGKRRSKACASSDWCDLEKHCIFENYARI